MAHCNTRRMWRRTMHSARFCPGQASRAHELLGIAESRSLVDPPSFSIFRRSRCARPGSSFSRADRFQIHWFSLHLVTSDKYFTNVAAGAPAGGGQRRTPWMQTISASWADNVIGYPKPMFSPTEDVRLYFRSVADCAQCGRAEFWSCGGCVIDLSRPYSQRFG